MTPFSLNTSGTRRSLFSLCVSTHFIWSQSGVPWLWQAESVFSSEPHIFECAGCDEWLHADCVQSPWPNRATPSRPTQTRHSANPSPRAHTPTHAQTRVWTWFGPDRSSVCARIPCWQGSQWAQYHNDSRRECAHSEEPLWHLQPEQEQGSPPTTTLPYPGSHRDPDSASPGIDIRARAALVCKYAFIDAWVYFMQQQEGPCEAHSTCQHKQREVRSQRLPAQHEEIIEPSLPVGLPSALHLLPYFSDQRLSLSNTQEKAHTHTHTAVCDSAVICTLCVYQ